MFHANYCVWHAKPCANNCAVVFSCFHCMHPHSPNPQLISNPSDWNGRLNQHLLPTVMRILINVSVHPTPESRDLGVKGCACW